MVAASLIVGTGAMNLAGLRFSGRVQLVLASVLALLMTATMAVALARFGNNAHARGDVPHEGAAGMSMRITLTPEEERAVTAVRADRLGT